MSYSRPHQAGTATARDTSSASRLLIGFREEHPIGKHLIEEISDGVATLAFIGLIGSTLFRHR